ncbi:MAG: DUF5678 domain-containing protein [archaeon]
MANQELQTLENFERDSKWFHENINKLRKEGFTEKFVAIKNSEPIASGRDVNAVISEVEKKGENPSFIFVEYVYPEGFTLIL